VAKGVFGTLEVELFNGRSLQSPFATRAAVAEDIDAFYNVRRRHSSIGNVSLLE